MTDDYKAEYPYGNPRPYSYFKVKFTIYNKVEDEYNSIYGYFSTKYSLKWLTDQIPYNFRYPLPRDYFDYTYQIVQVEDSDDITFHHITTREAWEREATRMFLTACATGRWKVSWIKKIQKKLQKIRLFINNKLFIDVTTIKV